MKFSTRFGSTSNWKIYWRLRESLFLADVWQKVIGLRHNFTSWYIWICGCIVCLFVLTCFRWVFLLFLSLCCMDFVYHFYCGWGVYCIDCSYVSYVQLINQCGLYVDKIKIYEGALNRSKFTASHTHWVMALYCLEHFFQRCIKALSVFLCLGRKSQVTSTRVDAEIVIWRFQLLLKRKKTKKKWA